MKRLILLGVMASLPLILHLPLEGQGGARPNPPPVPGASPMDTVDLRLEREVFTYPQFGRRNPFRPLLGDESGPRYEDLELLGVFLSPDPSESLALIGIYRAAAVVADSVLVETGGDPRPGVEEMRATRSRTNRMRVGDRWGNIRVAVIESNRVLVDVTEFGLTDRRELLLRRPAQGGIR